MTKLHIENLTINLGGKPSMQPIGLLAALASIGEGKPCNRNTGLPAIGDKWPGQLRPQPHLPCAGRQRDSHFNPLAL